MSNLKTRLKRMEDKIGLSENESYWFIIYGYKTLSDCERKGIAYYCKGNIGGGIIIWRMQGKKFIEQIDSNSERGQKILEENGYKKC
ncbi:MAG: hypothetical protein ABSE81_06310 [Candidatus Omnitrophota bacterium]|jgi:hypothetical protein